MVSNGVPSDPRRNIMYSSSRATSQLSQAGTRMPRISAKARSAIWRGALDAFDLAVVLDFDERFHQTVMGHEQSTLRFRVQPLVGLDVEIAALEPQARAPLAHQPGFGQRLDQRSALGTTQRAPLTSRRTCSA